MRTCLYIEFYRVSLHGMWPRSRKTSTENSAKDQSEDGDEVKETLTRKKDLYKNSGASGGEVGSVEEKGKERCGQEGIEATSHGKLIERLRPRLGLADSSSGIEACCR